MTDVRPDGGNRIDRDDPTALARAYYRALDEHDYDLLASLLAPAFVHERPDRTIEGRERFVRFMRDERPQTDTSHPIDGVYVSSGANGNDGTASSREVVVRGRLLAADEDVITAFVDVFTVDDGRLQALETYTN